MSVAAWLSCRVPSSSTAWKAAARAQFARGHRVMLTVDTLTLSAAAREARRREMEALPAGYLKSLTSVDGVAAALDCSTRSAVVSGPGLGEVVPWNT